MAIKIKGTTVIDDNENLTVDGYATIGSYATIGGYATIAGDVTIAGKVLITNTTDVQGGGTDGAFIIGDRNALNIGIDNNEIHARDGVSTSTLNLNLQGGNVKIGPGDFKVNGVADIPMMEGRGFARPFKVTKAGNLNLEDADGAYWDVTDWTSTIDGVSSGSYGWMGNKYKVPEDGIYLFGFTVKTDDFNGNPDSFNMRIKNSNGDTQTFYNDFNDLYAVHMQQGDDDDTESHSFNGTAMFECSQGDQINLQYTNTESGSGYIKSGGSTTFWGYMIAPGTGKESEVSEGGY